MKVGIIGAGTMGSRASHRLLLRPKAMKFFAISTKEFAANGKRKCKRALRRGRKKANDSGKLLTLFWLRSQQALRKTICRDCDLVVEAALENMEIKKQTFKELDRTSARQTASLLPTHPLCPLQRSALAWIVRLSACTSSIPLRYEAG